MAPLALRRPRIRTRYRHERPTLSTPDGRARILLVAVAFLLAPQVLDSYYLDLVNLVAIAAIGAIGVDILLGHAGQLSVGHAAFAAVGAYAVVNLAGRADLPVWLAVPGGALAAGVVSLAFGVVAVRIRGVYLAIATLSAQFVIVWVLNHWDWVTGGTQVAARVAPEKVGPVDTATVEGRYYLIVGCLLLAVLVAGVVVRSRAGRAFVAIRDHSLAAAGTGVAVFRYTLLAFFVSSCYAGASGALFAYNAGAVTPDFFPLSLSISYLAMIIIGGVGSVAGAVSGAAFVTLLPIVLRDGLPNLGMALTSEAVANLQLVVFGAAVLAFLIIEPGGLATLARRIVTQVSVWPYRAPPEARSAP